MRKNESEEKRITSPPSLEPLVAKDPSSGAGALMRNFSSVLKSAPDNKDSAERPFDSRGSLHSAHSTVSDGLGARNSGRFGTAEQKQLKNLENKEAAAEQKQLFIDANAMKKKVRENLMRKKYAVTDYYKDTGLFQAIVRNSKFENLTLTVIALNAIWIAVDTDYNGAEVLLDAHALFQMAENLFCAYFSFEWVARYCSFRLKRNCLKDAWFIFDSALVLTMVLETWVMTAIMVISGGGGGGGMGNASILRIARLLRLSRMARMARLLRAMPELMVLIKGMLAATRSVFFTLCLLILIMYIFAIAFTQLTAGTQVGDAHFSSVSVSMYTLLVHGALLDDVSGLSKKLGTDSYLFAAVFFIFSLLAALTVMNMLIGVLCEVVSAVAATEKEEMLVSYVHEKLKQVLSLLDTDGDQQISKNEFIEIMLNIDAARALQEVGVDVVGLVDFADFIFVDYDEDGNDKESDLSFEKFMEVILQLRGTNHATVKDIVDMRKFIQRSMIQSNDKLHNIQHQLAELSARAGICNANTFHSCSTTKSNSHKESFRVDSSQESIEVVDQAKELKDTAPDIRFECLSFEKSIGRAMKPIDASSKRALSRFDVQAAEGNTHGYPIHIVSTPSVTLLHDDGNWLGKCSEALVEGLSREVEATAQDIIREGRWHQFQAKNLVREEGSNYPGALTITRGEETETKGQFVGREKQIAPLDSKISVLSGTHEADSLKGQIAKLGSVLESGIIEYHKLQDWVVQEKVTDVSSQGSAAAPQFRCLRT